MSISAEFLREYQDNILYFPVLLPSLSEKYRLCACLKYMEHKQVYLLQGTMDDKKYIMKCVDKTSHENLKEEYELQKSLNHYNIASVVEFVEGDKVNYLIREYIEGCTITELVEMTKDGHLNKTEAVKITIQLSDILSYLHTQDPPIIHRDIKPDNVIYTKEGGVKLIDFGISRRYSAKQEKDTVIMGTEYTAPPEQFGYKQTDARSDIYSIGVLLFYMITGSLDINEIDQCEISNDIKNIIRKCTEFSPSDRYSNMKQLEQRLLRLLEKEGKGRGWIYFSLGAALVIPVLCLIFWKGGGGNASLSISDLIKTVNHSADIKQLAIESEEAGYQSENSGQNSTDPSPAARITQEVLQAEKTVDEGSEALDREQSVASDFESLDTQQAADTVTDALDAEKTAEKEAILEGDNTQEQTEVPASTAVETPAVPTEEKQTFVVQSGENQTVREKNTPYVFHSPLIEEAVRQELGLPDSEIITLKHLDEIEELYICGEQVYNAWSDHFVYGRNQYMNIPAYIQANVYRNQGSIDSLEDIAHMHNIRTLALYNQKISDLTPLQGLKHIIRLGLGTNNISNISQLASLKTLQLLDLSGNPVDAADMAVLKELPDLTDLDLGETEVKSLYNIKQLKLKNLSLFGTYQGDCAGLNEMKSLEVLTVGGIGVGVTELGMSNVVQLPQINHLKVMGSQNFDVSIFTSMKKLKYLDMCGCNLTSIEGLVGLDLQELLFDENQVRDLSPLVNFPNLEMLGIRNNPCEDYTPLSKLSKLRFINVNEQQIVKIKEQLKDASYTLWLQQ